MTNNVKRLLMAAIIMALMLAVVVGTCSAAVTTPNYWGNKIGSFTYNGVEVGAYSNGYIGYFYPLHGTYGHQFQCVEYVNRFYSQALGFPNMGDPNTGLNVNANQYFSKAPSWGLTAYKNGGTTPPQMGDIICSNGNGAKDNVGHVAIVRQVLDDSIRVIHQNWKNIPSNDASNNYYNQECNYYRLGMKKSASGQYTVSGFSSAYPVVGWLHKP